MKEFQVAISVMNTGRGIVKVPSEEDLAAGLTPDVSLFKESLDFHKVLTLMAKDDLTTGEAKFGCQLVLNALTVNAAEEVAEATQEMLDKVGMASVSAFPTPEGASA